MTFVEDSYNRALDAMSGQQRVERTLSLFESMCDILTLQIRREFPGLEGRELRQKVAARLYMADTATLALLQRASSD